LSSQASGDSSNIVWTNAILLEQIFNKRVTITADLRQICAPCSAIDFHERRWWGAQSASTSLRL